MNNFIANVRVQLKHLKSSHSVDFVITVPPGPTLFCSVAEMCYHQNAAIGTGTVKLRCTITINNVLDDSCFYFLLPISIVNELCVLVK